MIWNLLIIDASGTLLYSWIHKDAPQTLLKKYEPTLIAGFISAIIQFGHEILVHPQRIDFGEIAMSFYSRRIKNKTIWFAVLSDSSDPRQATVKFLEIFVQKSMAILEELSDIEGITITTEDIETKLSAIVQTTLKKVTRFLPEIRSSDKKSLPLSLLLTIILGLYIDVLFKAYLFPLIVAIPNSQSFVNNLIVVSILIEYGFIGTLSGLIAGRGLAGGISAYLSTAIISLIMMLEPIQIIIIATTLGVWSGIAGYLSGRYFDSKKLTYIPKKHTHLK